MDSKGDHLVFLSHGRGLRFAVNFTIDIAIWGLVSFFGGTPKRHLFSFCGGPPQIDATVFLLALLQTHKQVVPSKGDTPMRALICLVESVGSRNGTITHLFVGKPT